MIFARAGTFGLIVLALILATAAIDALLEGSDDPDEP